MIDTFLELHRVGPLQFTISSPLTPISIRDQMVRAKLFVDRAIAAGLISQDRALFVLGAGAGGATAAVCAAERNIPTTIIELKPRAFDLQRRCLSRWIDPTQYDWPADHWIKGLFPWTHPEFPIPWVANYSNLIAGAWVQELRKAHLKPESPLEIKYNTQLVSRAIQSSQDSEGILEVTYESSGEGLTTKGFGAALYARGFGTERSTCSDYRGFDFWETDNLEDSNLGLPASALKRQTLICGGGDGALQDFLRIATGKRSAAEILKGIQSFIDPLILSKLYSEEDQGYRARVWNDKKQDHAVFNRLEAVHRELVDQMFSDRSNGDALAHEIDLLLQHANWLRILLVHPCSHFTATYPLNRFLVHLILSRSSRTGVAIERWQETSVVNVVGTDHQCNRTATVCHGQEHAVSFTQKPDCYSDHEFGKWDGGRFEAVILRLGVNPPKPFDLINRPMFFRHLLPYHPPS
jgi:hypothetical protein